MVVKRQERRLPSVGRHFLQAIICLAIIPIALWATYNFFGDAKDSIATGHVMVEAIPLPENSDSLNGNTNTLPDLLRDEVPKNVNPTIILDALGNPVKPDNPNDLAGGTSELETPTLIPQQPVTGPKTIMIDGRPLDGSAIIYPGNPLPPAPIAGLTRSSPFGLVPTPALDGRKSVTSYARPYTPSTGKQSVAIIIGGLGIDRNLTRRVISELPPEVSLSFAAHANGLQTWINQARARGHEVIVELPMESNDFNPTEPGADKALLTTATAAQNIRNLDWLMSRAQGYFAMTNYNGDKIVRRSDVMSPILSHMSNAGIGFIYDGAISAPSVQALASSVNLPYSEAYNLIDQSTNPSAVQAELTRLKAQASSGTTPIGIGFAYPSTLSEVKNWIKSLDANGLELAPASYAMGQK